MPIACPRRWHRGSEFGPGPRVPLDRERRAVWRARLDIARRAGRLTALHAEVGRALLRRLGEDGRCDPAHETLATDAGCGARTVRRALAALAGCGLVRWTRRLVRAGWQAVQTSSAYALTVGNGGFPCDGQIGRGTLQERFPSVQSGPKAARKVLRNKAEAAPPSNGSDEWARWNAARQIAALATA